MNLSSDKTQAMLNKVPEVTLYFWIIKILCTTVGESAADYLSVTLNLWLTLTSIIMSVLLIITLVMQFRARKYVPSIYWISVVLISIVGTLITDLLVDDLGMSLVTATVMFTVALAAVFIAWYRSEKTLSIHSITTTRREWFYWGAILCTFALGTAAGDLFAEHLGLGYGLSAVTFAWVIAVIYAANKYLTLGDILGFWMAYILTRPLWASIGDLLAQAKVDGGLGLGTTITSVIFLVAIAWSVWYIKQQSLKQKPS